MDEHSPTDEVSQVHVIWDDLVEDPDSELTSSSPTKQPLHSIISQAQFDAQCGIDHQQPSVGRGAVWLKCLRCLSFGAGPCNGKRVRKAIFSWLPVLSWLPRYNYRDLLSDILAGVTVGVMHIPQGMAYASLAGLSPVHGLYTSFFSSLVYFFLGTSRHISFGTFTVASLMVGEVRYEFCPGESPANGISPTNESTSLFDNTTLSTLGQGSLARPVFCLDPTLTPVVVATTLTFLVGIIQLCMGLFHLGFLAVFLSDQLIGGFTTGAAVMGFTGQINKLIGVKLARYSGVGKLYYVYRDFIFAIPNTNIATLVISVICLVVLFGVKEYFNPWFQKKTRVPFPIDLLMVILATVISHVCSLHGRFDVKIVSSVPKGLPSPTMPKFSLLPQLFDDALSLAVVIFSTTTSLAKIYAKRHNYVVDANQELYAYSMVQIIISFFGSWCAGGSLSRSSVNESAGSRTQMSSFIACVLLLIVLLFVGPLLRELPMCVLACIVIVALKGMFMQLKDLRTLWPISKLDFSVWLISFLATCILDVTWGLLVSVVYSLLTVVYRTQWATSAILGRVPNTDMYRRVKRCRGLEEIDGVKIFRFDGPLFFANAELFREQLYRSCRINMRKILSARRRNNAAGQRGWPLLRQLSSKVLPNNGGPAGRKQRGFLAVFRGSGSKQERKASLAQNFSRYPLAQMPVTVDAYVDDDDATTMTSAPSSPGVRSLDSEDGALHPSHGVPHHVVVDFSGVNFVDTMGAAVLKQIYTELQDIGIVLVFAHCKDVAYHTLATSGLLTVVPERHVCVSVADAVRLAQFEWDLELVDAEESPCVEPAPSRQVGGVTAL